MAHFAKLDENKIVQEVIVVNNEDAPTEEIGIAFLVKLFRDTHTNWKQTSYNGSFRKNFAGVGYTYDTERDAFIPPKPFLSWVLNEETCRWVAPVTMPQDGKMYQWDEATLAWVEAVL